MKSTVKPPLASLKRDSDSQSETISGKIDIASTISTAGRMNTAGANRSPPPAAGDRRNDGTAYLVTPSEAL